MLMATKTRRWTRADLDRLPNDGNRYELLDGVLLVTPQAAPVHQWMAQELLYVLGPYVKRHKLGVVMGPGAVVFEDNELQPDAMVVPSSPRQLPAKWDDVPRPLLVAEVLSRTTQWRDRGAKRQAYQRLGIPTYWIIDRFERRAFVWTPDSEEAQVVRTELRWHPKPDVEPLVIQLADILPPLSAPEPIDDED
jgi:Uma2 family endonuclease